jgi:DDE superfamily endonuclease
MRHSIRGKRSTREFERVGLRLHLRRLQAFAGDITLLFVDEADVLNIPYLVHTWARKGINLRIEAPGKVKRRCLSGAHNARTRELFAHVSTTKRTSDFLCLLDLIEARYGPKSDSARDSAREVVIVLDNGPSHTSHETRRALLSRASWLTVEWLPKFSPELNDIERDWRVLKGRYLGNRNYAHEGDLERSIFKALERFNADRVTGRRLCKL